ncbi:MAG: peptidoglycan bridge formation glycyltransferase FemA/FemB family protein [Chloroflexota bacterium]
MPIVSLADWNQFLQNHPNAHLLQTGEWGELKSAFGWDAVRVVNGEVGAQILFRRLPLGFTVGYLPKGPVCSEQLSVISHQSSVVSEQFWSEVHSVCKQHRAIFLKIEPNVWEDSPLSILHLSSFILHPSSFILSKHNIQPPRTIIINVEESEEQILARMKQKTRYNIRLAEKKGVTVRAWDDLAAFHKMMLLTGERDGFGVHSLEYYQRAYNLLHPKDMCEILLAEFEGKPLAALMVARSGDQAYYLYGASTDEERNRMPTYLLQWEAVRWAKARGCDEYDLWGVPDADEATLEANFEKRRDGLWGVYRFKRGFGGELKRAAQALDRVYHPLLYKLYLWRMAGRETAG